MLNICRNKWIVTCRYFNDTLSTQFVRLKQNDLPLTQPWWTNWFVPFSVHVESGHWYEMHTSPGGRWCHCDTCLLLSTAQIYLHPLFSVFHRSGQRPPLIDSLQWLSLNYIHPNSAKLLDLSLKLLHFGTQIIKETFTIHGQCHDQNLNIV